MWTITNIKNIFYDESFKITKIFGFERYLKWDPYYICQQNIHRLSKVHLKYLFLLSYELEHCNNIELNLNQSLKKEMPVKDQLQGMLDRAPSKKNFEPSFVKIGWRVQKLWAFEIDYFWSIIFPRWPPSIMVLMTVLEFWFFCVNSR